MSDSDNAKRLISELQLVPGESVIALSRTLAFGAAAVCLAIVVQILQIGASDLPLMVSLYASAVAMPLWLCAGVCLECYLYFGPRSFAHYSLAFRSRAMKLIHFAAAASLFAAIAGVVYHLSVAAFWLFFVTTIVATVLYAAFFGNLANWWYGLNGPGSNEHHGDT